MMAGQALAVPAALFPDTVGQSTAIPAQFRGLARQYFREIDSADEAVRVLVRETLAPFQLRGQRGYRNMRQDMLADVARRWRVCSPGFGRLGLTVETSKRALEISEIRVTGAHQRFAHWADTDASERALVIGGLRVDVFAGAGRTGPVEYQLEVASRASISFHAVGRWFQRSRDTAPEALHDATVDIL